MPMLIRRLAASLFALLFLALGLAFVLAPDMAGARLNLAAVGVAGLSVMRADLGGLFLGLAILALAGAWRRRPALLVAAAVVLAAIILGRLVGLVAEGPTEGMAAAFLVEVSALAAFLICARGMPTESAPTSRRGLAIASGVAVILALGLGAALSSPSLQQAGFAKAAGSLMGVSNAELLKDDALRVGICGSSAPLPSRDRAKACVAVMAGGKIYLVDVGPESVENLMLWRLPLDRIGGVLVTHFHSDHIGDLGELNLQTWAAGRAAPMKVYGGPGIERVVGGFNEAYALDQGYRTAHHSPQMMPAETWPMVPVAVPMPGAVTPALDRTAVVLDDGALKITALEVDHAPVSPAYAYRFDYKGRSVVVTGDLQAHAPLIKGAKDADVLVSEAIGRDMIRAMGKGATAGGKPRVAKIMHDVQDYHVGPDEAADIANKAGVKLLVFYHLLPAPDNPMTRRAFAKGVSQVRKGDWVLADDNSLYTLPIGSKAVEIGRIGR